MTQYQEILENLKNGKCDYGNERSEIFYSLGNIKMKFESNGEMKIFNTLEEMARNINKFMKTGN